jgi:23S rRNA pseudouridine1911/1915/1917 synthase
MGGREAITHYQTEQVFGARAKPLAARVRATLETGRTHQIRVHFSAAGHPVIGDTVYGPRNQPATAVAGPRQMLHARRLGFTHPRTAELVRADSPLPVDIEEALAQLRTKRKEPRETRGSKRSRD